MSFQEVIIGMKHPGRDSLESSSYLLGTFGCTVRVQNENGEEKEFTCLYGTNREPLDVGETFDVGFRALHQAQFTLLVGSRDGGDLSELGSFTFDRHQILTPSFTVDFSGLAAGGGVSVTNKEPMPIKRHVGSD